MNDPAAPSMDVTPQLNPTSSFTESPPPKRRLPRVLAYYGIVAAAIALIAGTYWLGNSRGYASGKQAQLMTTQAKELKVPPRATMIAQCAVGEGTQYVLPSDIPKGPIYNVWNNKVTGIGYMLSQSEIANARTLDLALKNQKYDHLDVAYIAAGHAGFTEPHYHVTLSLIPYKEEQKISCDNGASSQDETSHPTMHEH